MSDARPSKPPRQRVVIAINPVAGRVSALHRAERLAQLLRIRGVQADLVGNLGTAAAEANEWHRTGRLAALVAVGGDGTASSLVNGTDPGVPFSILPAGTENLLARYFRLGKAPEELCRTILDGHRVQLDTGSANGRVFLLMATCGFDADVVEKLHHGRLGNINHLHYVKPILNSIRSYPYPELRIRCAPPAPVGRPEAAHGSPEPTNGTSTLGRTATEQEEADVIRARWCFAFNLPCYGMGLPLMPEADGTDGLLDVVTFRRGGLFRALCYLMAVVRRRHQRLADCTVRRVTQIRVEADQRVPYNIDGDPGGELPVDIQVLPRRLNLLVPKE